MNRLLRTVLFAAATTATTWAVQQWLNSNARRKRLSAPRVEETWENEGGALAPQHVAVETSQVPR